MKNFSIIVAIDEAGGIGRNGRLPWRLPGELRHFREVTVGEGSNAVIMGETTWWSLPEKFRPLPERRNIVLSKENKAFNGARTATSFEEAFAHAASAEKIFIIGGASVYQQAITLDACREIFVTRVKGEHGCDVFFPVIPADFRLVAKTEPTAEADETYWFERYVRD